MSRADVGREALYAAEIAAFDGTSYEVVTDFDELLELVRTVTTAPWWPGDEVAVVRARRDASSSSTRQRGSDAPVVRLAAPQMTPATVLHELAHVLAGVGAGHGEVFRRAYLDLVGFAFGHTEAGWLLDAYAVSGLAPGERRWPAPPAAHGAVGPIAL